MRVANAAAVGMEPERRSSGRAAVHAVGASAAEKGRIAVLEWLERRAANSTLDTASCGTDVGARARGNGMLQDTPNGVTVGGSSRSSGANDERSNNAWEDGTEEEEEFEATVATIDGVSYLFDPVTGDVYDHKAYLDRGDALHIGRYDVTSRHCSASACVCLDFAHHL